jgi:hypothetical protein
MNDDNFLMQHYLLKKIYESLHDTYNSINEYQLFDNSNLDNIVNYENYNLLISIINFSNVINNDLIKLKNNEITIDNSKRKRNG